MEENNESLEEKRNGEHSERDAETQTVLGIFISIMAIPVLVGTFWAEKPHAMVVNVIAGGVLLAIGILLAVFGRRSTKRLSK